MALGMEKILGNTMINTTKAAKAIVSSLCAFISFAQSTNLYKDMNTRSSTIETSHRMAYALEMIFLHNSLSSLPFAWLSLVCSPFPKPKSLNAKRAKKVPTALHNP